jgi:hypothetical protein
LTTFADKSATIQDLINRKHLASIVLEWKDKKSVGRSTTRKYDSRNDKNEMNEEEPKNINTNNYGQDNDLIGYDGPTDLVNFTTKQVRASKRLRRLQLTKNNDFL